MAMLDLLPRTTRARRVAGKPRQIGRHVVGVLHMALTADMVDIARLVEDQRAKAQPPVKKAGFDFKAQGAKRYNERDKVYYGNVLKHFDQHMASSRAPTFTYIITSATHLPYRSPYEPEVNVPGGGAGTDPEMNEYLRRLAMAKMDYDAFRADLLARFPDERFLIVQYGDHQPVATRMLLGFDDKLTAEDIKLTPESPGYDTYYTIEGLNYQPPPMPSVETLEVPYLGTVLLEAAGMPLSPAYQERMRLLKLCDGRYFTCVKQDEILGFHRRLIDSGLVDAR